MSRTTTDGTLARERLFDRQAIALTSVIFLTEAAIAAIFFSLVPQYTEHLLKLPGGAGAHLDHLPQVAAAYTGYAQSAYGFAKLPSQPFCGWLADRFGARRLLLVGLATSLVAVVAMAGVPSLTLFVVVCAAFGVTAAVIWPAVFALIGDSYQSSGRGRLTAAISGAQVAGSAVGFAVGAALIDHVSYAAAFGLALGFIALALVLGISNGRGRRQSASAAEAPASGAAGPRMSLLGSVLSANLVVLCSILVLVSLSVSLLVPDLKPYSGTVLDVSFSTFAILLAVPAAVAVLTLVPSGVIADRLGRSVPMLLAAGLWSASMFSLTLTRSVVVVIALAAVAAFAYALGLPAWSASLIDLSSAGRRGLQVGFASALQAVGLAAGPATGGMLVARFGTLAPFRCSAVLMLLVLALSVVYRARARTLYSGIRRASTLT